jgi:hypothetical protein
MVISHGEMRWQERFLLKYYWQGYTGSLSEPYVRMVDVKFSRVFFSFFEKEISHFLRKETSQDFCATSGPDFHHDQLYLCSQQSFFPNANLLRSHEEESGMTQGIAEKERR